MREMKDSGIEWIGDIPMDWEISRIKYVSIFQPVCDTSHLSADSIITYTPMENIKNGGYIPNTCEFGKLSSSLTQYCEGDIVMAKVTPCFENGNIAIMNDLANGFGLGSSELFVFRPYHINTKYLFYWLRNYTFIEEACSTMTGTGGLKRISPYFMKNCYLHIPPVNEQQTIAVFLDKKCSEIDDVIAKTRATIEEYKKLKQSVITEAVTKGIRPNRDMKDSGIEWIGEIPKEWGFVKITRILDYNTIYPIGDGDHGLVKPTDYQNSGIPYIRVQNLGWGTELLLENIVYISEQTNEKIKNSTLHANDVLIAKTGATIGKTGIIPSSMPIANTTSHIGKITVDSKYNARFVFYVLSSYVGYRQFWEFALLKTTRPELAIDEIKTIRITLPHTIDEQQEIVDYLDKKCSEIDTLIARKEQIVTELESYKKSIIYEYVTGKKEVIQWTAI